jgi:hypothetical protein
VPAWERVGAQVLVTALVLGSYFAAEWLKVRLPRRRGEHAAAHSTAPGLETVA